ncbi:MAG: sulfite exporter TauE/SafE family protein [Gammaproteobacteria bacterium]|nr:sulfite exporter TauE/SafE family protein [Gammaproteobacteria bacterium]HOP17550.1 sulfite exporter TauE/SafE family protein [Gammaproteobacteria bacterium]
MFSVLILGLLLGLQHAVEADHLAAVASLSTRSHSLGDAARHGLAWGLGHALTLLVFGGSVLLLGGAIGPHLALLLEAAVGLMLVVLGVDVLLRLWRKRVHYHVHSHGEESHFHAHSHVSRRPHTADPHQHLHKKPLPLRALMVGMVHGMAGSAALMVFALGSVQSIWQGLAYMAMFGLGSIVGMLALAVVISLPLRWSAQSLTWAHNGLTAILGLFTIGLGALLLQQSTHGLMYGIA